MEVIEKAWLFIGGVGAWDVRYARTEGPLPLLPPLPPALNLMGTCLYPAYLCNLLFPKEVRLSLFPPAEV